MKSSTLHRSNLSRERMQMIENIKQEPYRNSSTSSGQYMKFQDKPELDVLWRGFEKSLQPKSKSKAPAVYAGIGFILGLVFSLCAAIIIGVSTYGNINKTEYAQIKKIDDPQTNVSIMPADSTEHANRSAETREEKYTIKAGDTLDKIAYRFYGKYDLDKIEEIKKLNNIKNETAIQIGQVLIIPVN